MRRNGRAACTRRYAGAATTRKAATTSRKSSSRSPSRVTACRCAPGCCPATPPTWRRWRGSRTICVPGGWAAVCSSAMPGCIRPTTWPSSAAAWVATSSPCRCASCATSRPRCYKPVADNLLVKEVWVGDGERRKRYVLCLNPQEAERERARRAQLLAELDAELALLEQRQDDHPKAACALLTSRRYGRYLSKDWRGRPRLDAAKVKAAEKFDGKFVVI